MHIAVYCGSSRGDSEHYAEDAKRFGTWIGENGHTLVYGGGNNGLMGVIADAVLAAGGDIVGVLPDVPVILPRRHEHLTECIITPDIARRRSVMIERADAFVALPGGIGTLDEISEVLSLSSLGLLKAPIVFFDTDGYYSAMKDLLDHIVATGFGHKAYFEKVLFSSDLDEIASLFNAAR